MELFGYSLESIYLGVLIVSGLITLFYLFFGEAIEGALEAADFLNPTTVLAFITIFSGSSYLFESLSSISSGIIILIGAAIALLASLLLHFFILVPLKSAEESLAYTEQSLNGRIGKVIITVPADGFGEVVIESFSGMISKPAASYDNTPIPEGNRVLVIDVTNGVLQVKDYEKALDLSSEKSTF
ncbi:hypothetical protein [Jeotgalibacillus proteolyticus]|uniref:Membrane protein NfeD2 N-terminal transmembrane domain-containing protein n=1 Tax=Jeotgalibacillus proteolyticus TaxID=2082395 RepID=A0A2S5GC83_9BACL|nr:hypothetical protein [Jeotgalibacillus proteolyticus]PPA70599.1 hypothetical protein C4B60_07295 [Jeotgalibacillus proteolyticus]